MNTLKLFINVILVFIPVLIYAQYDSDEGVYFDRNGNLIDSYATGCNKRQITYNSDGYYMLIRDFDDRDQHVRTIWIDRAFNKYCWGADIVLCGGRNGKVVRHYRRSSTTRYIVNGKIKYTEHRNSDGVIYKYDGCVLGDCFNGHGVKYMSNLPGYGGETVCYSGDFRYGRFHGKGYVVGPDGRSGAGIFENGKLIRKINRSDSRQWTLEDVNTLLSITKTSIEIYQLLTKDER